MQNLNASEQSQGAVSGIHITNFMGIKSLDHEFGGRLTVVTGPNASGKSSFATALRGCVASDQDPLSLGDRQTRRYAHNGSKNCHVKLDLAGDEVQRNWEPASRKLSGSVAHPQKPIVVGLEKPFKLRTDKEINEFWDNIVTVKINKEHVITTCQEMLKSYPSTVGANISVFIDEIMRTFPAGECDRDEIKRFHSMMKNARMATIGTFNGVKTTNVPANVKGANLMPYLTFDIPSEYDTATPEDLKKEIERLHHDLNNKYRIATSDTWKKYREDKKKLDDAQANLKELEKERDGATDIYQIQVKQDNQKTNDLRQVVEKALAAVEKIRAEDAISSLTLTCPECAASLSYDSENKILWKPDQQKAVSEVKRAQIVDEWERTKNTAQEDIAALFKIGKKRDDKLADLHKRVDLARQKVEVYKALVSNKSDLEHDCGGEVAITIDEYREKVNKIGSLMGIKEEIAKKTTAQNAAYKAQAFDMLMGILDPGGLAARQRERGFMYIQNMMSKLEAKADSGFGAVTIDEDGRILIGGNPYSVASKSERFWAGWMIQWAFANIYSRKLGNQVLVADEVDILGDRQMEGFGRSVGSILDEIKGSQVVVCGTDIKRAASKWNIDHPVNYLERQ